MLTNILEIEVLQKYKGISVITSNNVPVSKNVGRLQMASNRNVGMSTKQVQFV